MGSQLLAQAVLAAQVENRRSMVTSVADTEPGVRTLERVMTVRGGRQEPADHPAAAPVDSYAFPMLGTGQFMAVALLFALAGCGAESLPAAADGSDLAACADGSCEVLVESGDVLDLPDLGRVEVAIEEDMLAVASRSDDGQGNTSELSAAGAAGKQLVLNEQQFTVVAVLSGQGVLRVGS